MNERPRIPKVWILVGYLVAAAIVCMTLSLLAARITASQLLDQAALQRERVETNQPLWQWHTHKSRDVIAGRAFGHAELASDGEALSVTSMDGTPFELGLPVAWSLDLAHWPILEVRLQNSGAGTLGVVWQGQSLACLAPVASKLTPDTRILRADLRGLSWQTTGGNRCTSPGVAQMLRLRIQIPAHATLRLASVALLSTDPTVRSQDAPIDLPNEDVGLTLTQTRNSATPLFRLPGGISAEAMLTLRDRLRARWPAALIVPAGTMPEAAPSASRTSAKWMACTIYLLVLAWLAVRPVKGRWRPWLEIAGCLAGPLWLVIGLNWGLNPTPLGVLAFGGGLAYALTIERRYLQRLWRWPSTGYEWLWPLATLPVTVLLIVLYGHALHPLPLAHVFTYVGWALLQQWLMLVVLLPRFEHIVRRPTLAIFIVAIVFALLHTPNGMLMQLCFVGELWWACCFLRSRSVLPIGLAHAACALLVESGLVGGLVRSLEVSGRFFF